MLALSDIGIKTFLKLLNIVYNKRTLNVHKIFFNQSCELVIKLYLVIFF